MQPLQPRGLMSLETPGNLFYIDNSKCFMPRRSTVIATNEIYHVYNRSIAKEQIFKDRICLRRSLEILEYYRLPQRLSLSKFKQLSKELREQFFIDLERKSPLVEIYAFALMPNHFHLLVKQLKENGINKFVSNFQNSYAKYYNLKNNRDGSLFKNQFKVKWIESDEQFLHTSRYIHLNPVKSFLISFEQLELYPWTSYPSYMTNNTRFFIQTDFILGMFSSRDKYKKFIENQADYQEKMSLIEHIMIEE